MTTERLIWPRPALTGVRSGILALAVALGGGCASTEAQKIVTPAAAPVLTDRSCQSLRSEIMTREARGAARLVDRKNDGGKLNAREQAEIDTYNSLLNEYLGARCHLT